VSRRVPARALLRSEWTKLRSQQAAWVCVALYAGTAVVGGWMSLSGTVAPDDPATAVAIALVGFGPAQLALIALGAVVVTGEYRSGTVLASLTAVPRRTRWLLAKTVVLCVLVAALTAPLAAGCIAAVPALTAGTAELPLLDPVVLLPIGLQVGTAVLVTVLGVALGTLLRRTAAAVAAGALLVVVLPLATVLAGGSRVVAASRWWPTLRVGEDDVFTVANRGSFGVPAGGDVLLAGATGWQTGLLVVAGWALAAWVLGAVLLERRDV
jgi:ABC-2 type transport system permease protein